MTLISTCKAFAERTLPVVCGSLERAGVNDFVIVGDGFTVPTKVAGYMVQPAPVAGLWDMSALPYAAANLDAEWFVQLSDTCVVSLDYPEKIASWAAKWEYDLIGLKKASVMCFMGLYRKTYLEKNLSRIVDCAGMSKRDLVIFENSSAMVLWARRYLFAEALVREFDYQVDFYGTGRLRWHRYFDAFGVTKWTCAKDVPFIDERRSRVL